MDDGYSRSKFDRPSFKAMIEDVRVGKVDCVIGKDFSRFGREFIELLSKWQKIKKLPKRIIDFYNTSVI